MSHSKVEAILTELETHAEEKSDVTLMRLVGRLREALAARPAGGHTVRAGDIQGSTGVSVGVGNTVTVNQRAAVWQTLESVDRQLAALPAETEGVTPALAAEAQAEVAGMAPELLKGEEADAGFLAQRFRNLAAMGPDILDVVTMTLLNPAAGVSLVARKIAEKAREEGGLAPVA